MSTGPTDPTRPPAASDPAAPGARPVVLVTGATRGIGRAIAQELAADHELILGGRDAHALAVLGSLLRAAGGPAPRILAADLTDPPALAAGVRELGLDDGLDAVVHSAGILVPGAAEHLTAQDWTRSFAMNVTAVAELTRLLLPALRARRGTVLTVNSGSGYIAKGGVGAYAASKFALRAFTDALREEERPHGVRVVSIHPGRVDSDMQRELRAYEEGEYRSEEYIRPASVAAAVGFALRLGEDAVVETLSIRPRG